MLFLLDETPSWLAPSGMSAVRSFTRFDVRASAGDRVRESLRRITIRPTDRGDDDDAAHIPPI